MNRLQRDAETLQHFGIPETDNLKTLALQKGRACAILLDLLGVLSAVELDDKPMLPAAKVSDVRTDGLLPTELGSCNLQIAQSCPELAFGIGLRCSENASPVTKLR